MIDVAVGLVAGVGLGAFYFGALWLTVRRISAATRPALLVLGSYVARLGVLTAGLYGVVRLGGAAALVAALVAVLAVRHFAVRRIAGTPDGPREPSGEQPVVQGEA